MLRSSSWAPAALIFITVGVVRADRPQVDVGDQRGALVALQTQGDKLFAVIGVDGGERQVDLQGVERWEFAAQQPPAAGPRVGFRDGSEWAAREIKQAASGDGVAIESVEGFSRDAPLSDIEWILFNRIEATDQALWDELLADDDRVEDAVLIRRGGEPDVLPGVVAGVTEASVELQLGGPDGDAIPVPRARVLGIAFSGAAAKSARPAAACLIETGAGSTLAASQTPRIEEDAIYVTAGGAEITLDWSIVAAIDFAAVRATPLTALTPESQRYTPALWPGRPPSFLTAWRRPVVADDLAPLRLGFARYRSGLLLRSGQEIVYRISRRYRTFSATVGIDHETSGDATAVLVATGDGRELGRQTIVAGDDPLQFQIDVEGVGLLRFVVEDGGDGRWGDRVVIADARLQR